ncbi:hypothetical protein XENOCAPTIV_013549 [Xenoophorus captivus]|uniref:Calsequestrin n=1 Tax=Xenoophorus captivus TaxID=1517983 RepID=A0ABV0SG26_9TELE
MTLHGHYLLLQSNGERFSFLSLGTLSLGEKGLEIPEYDGKDRVHTLAAKNYKSIMKKYDVMVIYYHRNVDGNRSAMKQHHIEELALEVGYC